jgi:hypothetical protein
MPDALCKCTNVKQPNRRKLTGSRLQKSSNQLFKQRVGMQHLSIQEGFAASLIVV